MPELERTFKIGHRSGGGYPRLIFDSPFVIARPDRAEAISVAGTMEAGTSPLGLEVP